MRISKLRTVSIFCGVAAILLGMIEGYTREKSWLYIKILVMFLIIILMIADGIMNKNKIPSKNTMTVIIPGIICLLALISILMLCFYTI